MELVNVVGRPEFEGEIARMTVVLEEWLGTQGDSDMLETERAATRHMTMPGRLKLNAEKCDGPD